MILFYWMLIFVMVVWMAVKVGRSSVGMGVVTFLFWPIAIIPLITNWGQRDSDIRLQFFVVALATGLLWKAMVELALETGPTMQDGQIALVGGQDPFSAMQVESERDGVQYGRPLGNDRAPLIALDANGNPVSPTTSGDMAYYLRATGRVGGPAAAGTLSRSDRATVAGVGGKSMTSSAEPEVRFAPAMAKVNSTPLNEIRFRSGTVRLQPALSTLDVPEHFRFIARHQLGLLSELRDIAVTEHTLGWIVHERVNLNSADFWFVEVSFHDVGHLAPPSPNASVAAMQWDATNATAIWGRPAVPAERGVDQLAVKLTRHGAILFRAPELQDDQLELGLRAVRLLASRAEPESGWAHAEFIGEGSPLSLAEWVESLQAPAEPTVVAEREDGSRSS
jgi:hypothetical protein